MFMSYIGNLAKQNCCHSLNVNFWLLVRLSMWPLISFHFSSGFPCVKFIIIKQVKF